MQDKPIKVTWSYAHGGVDHSEFTCAKNHIYGRKYLNTLDASAMENPPRNKKV